MDATKNFLEKTFKAVDRLKENVSLVYDCQNKRLCVLKKIKSDSVSLYKILKKIDDRHIPEIYYLFRDGENFFVIEEYVEGQTLSEILRSGNFFSDEEIFSGLEQICSCLKNLHAHGIIHRDIKPSNLILTDAVELKLIDFDISRRKKENVSGDTEFLGTGGYAPPEQFGYAQTDERSDIYSLGATFQLFKPKSEILRRIVKKATSFNPDERYQNVDEILSELRPNEEENFADKIKSFFAKPFFTRRNLDEKGIAELLYEKLFSFTPKLPEADTDYRFDTKLYELETMLQYPGEFEYVYDTEDAAIVAGLLSFDENIYSGLDDYISQTFSMYESRQLKNYFTYEISKQNYYNKTNREVEKIIENIFDEVKKSGLKIPDASRSLKEFSCVPDFKNKSFDFDESKFKNKVRETVESLSPIKNFAAYEYAIKTRSTIIKSVDDENFYRVTEKKKYAFRIDKAVKNFFFNIFWAFDLMTRTDEDLRKKIHGTIKESYLSKLPGELKSKSEEIYNALCYNNHNKKHGA